MHHFGLGFVTPQLLDLGVGTTTVTGTAQAGKRLTATYNMDDPDGGETGISYQWYWADTSTAIIGATSNVYSCKNGDIGHPLNCKTSYTDAQGHASISTSNTTSAVIRAVLAIAYSGQADITNQSMSAPNFGSFPIGTAADDRYLFIYWYLPSLTNIATDLKVNGVSATGIGAVNITANHSSMWVIKVTAGTTCTIQGFLTSTSTQITSCAAWMVTGSGDLSPSNIASLFDGQSSGATLFTAASHTYGVALAGVSYSANTAQTIVNAGWTADGVRTSSPNRMNNYHIQGTGGNISVGQNSGAYNKTIAAIYLEAA